MALKVLTLNIWHNAGPWPERRRLIRQAFEELQPDVIGLQEVLQGDDVDLLAELSEGFGYETAFAMASPFWLDLDVRFGNAILSRHPIEQLHELRLPDGGDFETRGALTALIRAPFGPLCFSVTHLNWKLHHGHVRLRQVEALCEHVLSHRPEGGFPPVVVGDFNAEPDSDEIRYMRGLHSSAGRSVHFRDALRQIRDLRGHHEPVFTWDNRNPYARGEWEPNRCLDYIFVGYPLRNGLGHVRDARLVCDGPEDGVWPSDHFGVFAELETG
ncbi:MAG: endonuclease/exonuclease/phosphatase family protein [Myxococcales bacterium]|nr:endonuclease/exonuclease/phosphatase family protein [Myxococcales bacterium]